MDLPKHDLQHFKLLLLKQKKDLLKAGETGQQAEEIVELDQAMSQETGRRRRQYLVEVDAALKRIEHGEYGDCFECGETIKPGRLTANPAVTLCITCAQARE